MALDDRRACVTLDGHLAPREGLRYVVGLDLGLVSDRTVAAVCHSEGEVVALDRLQVWAGSRRRPVRLSDVEEWVEQAHQSYNSAPVVLDPWQAVGMAQRLRSRGLRVEEDQLLGRGQAPGLEGEVHQLERGRSPFSSGRATSLSHRDDLLPGVHR